MLLVASYIFYGWWDERFLFLIVISTAVDFCCGLMITEGRLTGKERCWVSVYTVLAAFFFITLQWDAVQLSIKPIAISVEWQQILPTSIFGWFVLLGTLLVIGIFNWIYPQLATIETQKRRRLFLIISICSNLGILAIFKYFNFFIGSAEAILSSLEVSANFWRLNLILPVGISFYTFQTMSYTIDVYQGKMKSTNRFLDFALFVSFFPQLVAGPIERASELLPRILNPRQLSFNQSQRGIFLILFGLFKKIGIADSIAGSVDAIYSTTGLVSWLDVVLATFLFTAQIYCDFSGYSDIARGTAKLFGIELMTNFNLPYFSKTPSEFWSRWHISLSTWLRDYLYIPLGGNRKGNVRTYQNLMTTMVLGGLWHGAGWNFILWGFYQGSLLCIYRFFTPKSKTKNTHIQGFLRSLITTLLFFILTCYGWLLFRANSLNQVIEFTKILFVDFGNFALTMPKPTLAGLIALPLLIGYECIEYLAGNVKFYRRYPAMIRGAFYATLTIIIIMG
ncbi:MAG: MBOAT family O-acyltransferase, partial [Microcoleaceae cyanobacterium]